MAGTVAVARVMGAAAHLPAASIAHHHQTFVGSGSDARTEERRHGIWPPS